MILYVLITVTSRTLWFWSIRNEQYEKHIMYKHNYNNIVCIFFFYFHFVTFRTLPFVVYWAVGGYQIIRHASVRVGVEQKKKMYFYTSTTNRCNSSRMEKKKWKTKHQCLLFHIIFFIKELNFFFRVHTITNSNYVVDVKCRPWDRKRWIKREQNREIKKRKRDRDNGFTKG